LTCSGCLSTWESSVFWLTKVVGSVSTNSATGSYAVKTEQHKGNPAIHHKQLLDVRIVPISPSPLSPSLAVSVAGAVYSGWVWFVPALAVLPLPALDPAASIDSQRTPLSVAVESGRPISDPADAILPVLAVDRPAVQTIGVVVVNRVLPVNILSATGAVRVEHAPR
jgi:hypothetical protein